MSGWPWASSEATDKVVPAFVAALQSVQDVAINKRADIETKTGARVRYGYADLDAVLDAAKPELTAKGLAVTQSATAQGVHAVLMHSSGQWLSFPPLLVAASQNTPQGQGSALTYARRYQMLAMLNIATEDDDARSASKPRKSSAAQPVTPTLVAPADPPTDAQTKKAMALFSEHGLSAKPDRLAYTSDVLGREVASWADVTKSEAGKVIDALEATAA